MTKIDFEENGFSLEQNLNGQKFKTFIYFDNVTNKIGYYSNISYFNIVLIIMFGILLFLEIFNHGFRIISAIYTIVIIYFIYDFIKNFQKYKTLSLNNSKDIYLRKYEYKYINEILEKRNDYFYKKYYEKIETYNDEDKIQTINWLYKEEVINKFQILKINNIKYNETEDKYYIG